MSVTSDIIPEGRVIRRVEIHVPEGKAPERIDVFLARQVAELTRSQASELINRGGVTVEGKQVKPSHKVKPGESILLAVISRPPLELAPEPIPLKVVWEDEWLLVIDKPAGLVVHPAAGNRSGTLVNALLSYLTGRNNRTPPYSPPTSQGGNVLAPGGAPERPGLVHRLDKATSGLLVVCKREPALSRLAMAFREHNIEREYRAICWWGMKTRRGRIDAPLGRDPRDRKKYCVREGGKPAVTNWEQLEKFEFLTCLALRLETGRTHQIRVHLSHLGHPVFGDPDYGGRNRQMGKLSTAQRRVAAGYLSEIDRQMLHAALLGFKHPITGEKLSFDSPLPPDMQGFLEKLRS